MDPESSIEMETKATNTSQGASPPTMNVTLSPVTWSETEEAIILPFRGRDFEPQLSFNLSDEGGSTYEMCTPETERDIIDTYYVPPQPPLVPPPPMDLQGYETMIERQRQHIRSTSRSKLVLEMLEDDRGTTAAISTNSINRKPSKFQTIPKHFPGSSGRRIYEKLQLSCGPNIIALLLVGSFICSIYSLMASEKNEKNMQILLTETRDYRNEHIPSLVATIRDLSNELQKLNNTVIFLLNHFNLTNSTN